MYLAGSGIRDDLRLVGGDDRPSSREREARVPIEDACEDDAAMLSVLRLVWILDGLASGALDAVFGASSSELPTKYSDATSSSLSASGATLLLDPAL